MYDVGIKIQIISFLSEFSAVPKGEIHLNSSISKDLGVEGDDAVELIEELANKFDIDMSLMNVKDYFVTEMSFSPFDVFCTFFLKKQKVLNTLYVKDLVEVAITKKWHP